jgi:hypothetical protein
VQSGFLPLLQIKAGLMQFATAIDCHLVDLFLRLSGKMGIAAHGLPFD